MTHTKGKTKLCTECAHMRQLSLEYCSRAATQDVNPVDGRVVYLMKDLCREQRSNLPHSECGPAGRYWESKWTFLKAWVGYALMACIALAALSEITGSDAVREAVRHTYPNMFN